MAQCEVCGNDYDLAFQVITAGVSHTFDSFECAIQKLAPICERCECKIVGHGVSANGRFFCSAHCARAAGSVGLVDSVGQAVPIPARAARAEPEGPKESWRGSALAEEPELAERRAASDYEEPRPVFDGDEAFAPFKEPDVEDG